MTLVRDPEGPRQADAIRAAARSSWSREALDETWRATGWPVPDGGSVARAIFGHMEYGFGEVGVSMTFDPDAIKGFMVSYALFTPATVDDPDAADLVNDPPPGWTVEPEGDRPRFDAAFTELTDALANTLGPPAVTGRHAANWSHAVWRCGERLVVNLQGEDPQTYGFLEAAYLGAVDHPAGAGVPTGEAVYDLLMG